MTRSLFCVVLVAVLFAMEACATIGGLPRDRCPSGICSPRTMGPCPPMGMPTSVCPRGYCVHDGYCPAHQRCCPHACGQMRCTNV